MRRDEELTKSIDWTTVWLFAIMVVLGWLNVFAAVYDPELKQSIFDFSLNSGKQLVWIFTTIVLITFILLIDYKFWDTLAYAIYGLVIISLIAVLVLGKEVAGSKSWFEIGSIRIQPAEFAKFATSLAIAKFLSGTYVKMEQIKTQLIGLIIIGIPVGLIILQGDTGSAMVFTAFLLVFFIEGMAPWLILMGLGGGILLILTLLIKPIYLYISFSVIAFIGILLLRRKSLPIISLIIFALVFSIAFSSSVDYVIKHLKPHQQNRIMSLVDPDADPLGAGWNVTQSKIAIGSGGFIGKGFLQGTQTKFDFVPEQSTDFIFCTIGEEHGWIGSFLLLGLFVTLFFRLIFLAERQKTRFARVYGYSVVCIMFFHFTVNIGMTIGLFPVVGIPLPFFSYGGSSLWSFTILLFIFLNLDANRRLIL